MKINKSLLYVQVSMLLVLIGAISLAAKTEKVKEAGMLAIDTSRPHARKPAADKIKKFQNDSSFDYESRKPPVTILDRFLLWLNSKIQEFFSWTYTHKAMYYTLRILLYAGIIFSVVFIVLKLLNSDIRGLFSRTGKNITDDSLLFRDITDNMYSIDFDALIEEYILKKEYRLVVRLCYTKMLKSLSLKKLIAWKIDKTNRDYLAEIKDQDLRNKFLYITTLFEYVWYGNVPLDAGLFVKVQNHFSQLDSMLGTNEKIH